MSGRDRLEALLIEVGGDVRFPETPEIVDGVLADLADGRPVTFRFRRLRVVLVGLAVVVTTVVAIPGPRRAIAELFGIGGVAITTVTELPPVDVTGDFTGDRVTLQAAQGDAGFTLLVPDGYRDPTVVYLDEEVPGGLVTLAYQPGTGTYGLVITQMLGSLDRPLLEKVVAPDTTVTPVSVGGDDGYWIEGDPHLLLVFDRDGRDYVDDPRLAGNTLLFVRDGVTIRIESGLDLEDTMEIAAGLEAYAP
jgi:hypothetical protein